MNVYHWCEFAFLTTVLAEHWGLPQPLGRVMLGVFWLLMLIVLVFGGRVL